jgi:hypothetical protein
VTAFRERGGEGGGRRNGGRTIIMGEKAAVDPSMAASAATLHAVFILMVERTMLWLRLISGPRNPNFFRVFVRYFLGIDSNLCKSPLRIS